MHLLMLLLYDMIFHNWECPLQNMFFSRFFFFYLGFLSRPFTNHRTAGEGGGHFFNSSPALPPASQTLWQKIGTTDLRAIKNGCRLKIDSKFIYSIGQVNNTFKFFQIRKSY